MVTAEMILALAAPLIGAGAGSYFGLKGALNGTREGVRQALVVLAEVRDLARDTYRDLEEHRRETMSLTAAVTRLDGTIRQQNDRLDRVEEREARDTALRVERRNLERGGS